MTNRGARYLQHARSAVRAIAGLEGTNARTDRVLADLHRRQTFRLIGELRRRQMEPHASIVDLSLAELSIFSQNGEDGVIASLVNAISDIPPFFVEFGVQDGSECNTRIVAEYLGWSGLYFEPDPRGFVELERRFVATSRIRTAREAVSPENINDLFTMNSVPERFGVLSIDIDGQDYWVWKALDERFQPDIVVVEYNSGFPVHVSLVEPSGTPFRNVRTAEFGATLGAFTTLAQQKGYQLVHCESSGVNAFFVHNDVVRENGAHFRGIVDRSPNYYLSGQGHPALGDRPMVTPPT